MIINHRYKYIFIEIPHTGSTAISKELCENYGGERVLHRHAHFFELKRIFGEKIKSYFVFAGVRNPLDDAGSVYMKFLNNHRSNYTSEKKQLKFGGYVTKRKLNKFKFVHDKSNDFSDFLFKFYRFPYTSNICVSKKYCDYIIRFETIDEGFANVLELIGIKPVRPLPLLNKTENKKAFLDYYNKNNLDFSVSNFGPFMVEWGYSFPDAWSGSRTYGFDKIKYEILKKIRSIYCQYVQTGPLKKANFIREIIE
ncbi:MAG: sulfotransferase family 2 domain-containing protein [Desulfobacteraceae bacterium]|nr:sulfotransferase family 2 domain-containing protein [Desulfobacteraceae bacterium]MBC2756765.1 sulfotransferase family 2 domain-containing protein [Desulfobacteraceae bacterium]